MNREDVLGNFIVENEHYLTVCVLAGSHLAVATKWESYLKDVEYFTGLSFEVSKGWKIPTLEEVSREIDKLWWNYASQD